MGTPGHLARWSCHRLECLAEFLLGYAESLKTGGCLVELFAGPPPGSCIESECQPRCLEARLLEGGSLFESLILLAKNQADAAALKAELKPLDKKHRVKIVIGNGMREDTLRCVFDLVPRSMTGIALVNPLGYASLRWSVIKKLAQHGVDWQGHKMALCIIFPLEMSLLRNVLRPSCRNSINRLYGTEAWQEIKQRYAARDLDLGWMRRRLIDLFKAQLKQLGYKHVEDVEPARFTNPPYYHVIWAGDGVSRSKELREIWGRERFLTCEMFRE